MSRYFSLTLTAGILLIAASIQAGSESFRYQIQVYRLSDGFRPETSLKTKAWQGTKKRWEKIKDAVTLFDRGSFSWSKKEKLDVTTQALSWNGKKLSTTKQAGLPEDRVKLIYSPVLIKRSNELARLKIEAKKPIQYLQKRPDGLLALKEISLPLGMDLEIKAVKRRPGVYLISYLEIELRAVGKREQIPGVDLDVGRPILQEWEYIMELELEGSKSLGILLKPKGLIGAVIVRITIADAPTSPPKKE